MDSALCAKQQRKLDRIKLDKQRHLINNFKLATELGAEVTKREK
jgi:hypothetical protein